MKLSIQLLGLALTFLLSGCNSNEKHVEENIKMYADTWDHIVNDANLDLINNTNFTEDITQVSSPENIIGIEAFKAYYSNFISGFSDIEFTIEDVFGQGDKIVKHWRFKGTHSGDFFGIPATNKKVDIEDKTINVVSGQTNYTVSFSSATLAASTNYYLNAYLVHNSSF